MIFTAKFTFFPIFYSQNFEFWFKSVYFSKFFCFVTLISPYFCTTAASLALAGYPRMAFWVATAASFFMISSILISLTELKYEYNCWEKYRLTMFYEFKDCCLLCLILIGAFLLHGLNFFLFNSFSKVLSLGMLAEILQQDCPVSNFFLRK